MQGQKSTVGPLPDLLNFEHGSSSSNAGRDQQFCWNNMQDSLHNQLPEYVISSSDASMRYLNPTSQEGQNTSGWKVGQSSSSVPNDQVTQSEQKTEHGWFPSASASAGPSLTLGEQLYESPNFPSRNNVNVNLNRNHIANRPSFLQIPSTDAISQDLNANPGFAEHGSDDCRVTRCPSARASSASTSSDHFGMPSGSVGLLVEENGDRPGCSLEGRRISNKRKALEGNVGQASASGSASFFQPAETGTWQAVPPRYNTRSSLSISAPSEHHIDVNPEPVNSRLRLGVGGGVLFDEPTPLALNAAEMVESSQRNFRMRINPSYQEETISTNLSSTGNGPVSNISASNNSFRFFPVNNNPLEFRPAAPTMDNRNPQRQSGLVQTPVLRRNLQLRWSGGSSSRPGNNSSGSSTSREVDTPPPPPPLPEDSNFSSMPRHSSGHPMFVPPPELRRPTQNPIDWGLTAGNLSFSRNVASSSRSGSTPVVLPSPASSNLVTQRNPAQYPRRLSEFVRRSLISFSGSESEEQNVNITPPSAYAASHDIPVSSGAGNQAHHLSSRSTTMLERQLDGAGGVPYALRTLAAANDGRSRLVSEHIRNMLDLMRQGEGLRFEDVMLLDQSIFVGMANLHDRHRDMRLDVDNMSYEELLALEDHIGYVSTGLSEDDILNRLKQRKYSSIVAAAQQDTEPCCVCQEEYNDGEDLGTLECGHYFHSGCIKQWLTHKNLCPICKTTALVNT